MSLLDRVRVFFDAPQFCPDCGKPIEVESEPTFDARTGARKDNWVWHCPEVTLTVTHRGIVRAEQRGDSIHPYGSDRPRWASAPLPENPR